MQSKGEYRLCACAMVFNEDGELLMGHRIGRPAEEGWQCAQGGFDEGESAEQAARRELLEEMGIRTVELIGNASEAVPYDVQAPRLQRQGLRGQLLHFTAFRATRATVAAEQNLSGTDTDPAEFDAVRWVTIEDALKLIWSVKRPGYEKALSEFKQKLG